MNESGLPGTFLGALICIYEVGVAGFEPTASSSRTKRATKLRHTPVSRRGLGPGATRITLADLPLETKSGFPRRLRRPVSG